MVERNETMDNRAMGLLERIALFSTPKKVRRFLFVPNSKPNRKILWGHLPHFDSFVASTVRTIRVL
jgi:hypothetical protein